MPLWTNWWQKGDAGDAPSWGKVPGLQAGETVRLQTVVDGEIAAYRARVRAVGMRRIFLDLAEATLPPRTPLTVSFERGDALYQFETRTVGPPRPSGVALAFPRQVVRVQRRQFYRLPLESPTTFRLLTDGGRIESAPLPARLVNLSGGGAQLAVSKPIPAGVPLSVRVPSGRTGEAIPVDAEVLECRVASQGTARIYIVRLRFYEPPRMNVEDREAIIAYLHEQQRLMLRTRKLLRA